MHIGHDEGISTNADVVVLLLERTVGPSYSPDGKKIAYTGLEGRDAEIYTIKVGGGAGPR